MVRNFLFSVIATLMVWGQAAMAQDNVYVQIEAQPSLSVAEDRLRDYASVLPDVNAIAHNCSESMAGMAEPETPEIGGSSPSSPMT